MSSTIRSHGVAGPSPRMLDSRRSKRLFCGSTHRVFQLDPSTSLGKCVTPGRSRATVYAELAEHGSENDRCRTTRHDVRREPKSIRFYCALKARRRRDCNRPSIALPIRSVTVKDFLDGRLMAAFLPCGTGPPFWGMAVHALAHGTTRGRESCGCVHRASRECRPMGLTRRANRHRTGGRHRADVHPLCGRHRDAGRDLSSPRDRNAKSPSCAGLRAAPPRWFVRWARRRIWPANAERFSKTRRARASGG